MGIDKNEIFGYGIYIDLYDDIFFKDLRNYCNEMNIEIIYDYYYTNPPDIFVGFIKHHVQNRASEYLFNDDENTLKNNISFFVSEDEINKLKELQNKFKKELDKITDPKLRWQIFCFNN